MKYLFAILILSSCSLQWRNTKMSTGLSLEDAQTACALLDSKQIGWNVASIAFGGLSGASGIASLALPDNKNVVYSMGSVSLVVTVASAISAYLASHYTQLFCRQCANVVPPAN